MNIKTIAITLILGLSLHTINAQALKTPAPSPTQTLKQNFALGEITIEYSRPSVKSRTVFGDLVPYGKIWRTGANSATKITFSDEVKLEGMTLAAGTYALYTIPGKDLWEIMLYKDLTLGGNVNEYKPENEVLRLKVKPVSTNDKTETFTMNVDEILPTSATIELTWDKVQVPIKVTTEIDARIMKNIETALATDTRPYYQAANYYFQNNKDLNKALEWVNIAIPNNPKAYWMTMLKARIQLALKDNKGAIETAEKTKVIATEGKSDEYIKMADELIAEAKKK